MSGVPEAPATQVLDAKLWLDTFDVFDRSKKGILHISDVVTVIRTLNYNPSFEDLFVLRREFADDLGFVNREKFVLMLSKIDHQDILREKLYDALSILDTDENGFIDSEKLKLYITTLGDNPFSQQEFEALMAQLDLTADDDIRVHNLVKVLLSKK